MLIKIETKKTIIPVEIGNLKFEFDASDSSIKELRKKAKEMEKKGSDLKDLDFENLSDKEIEKFEAKLDDDIKKGFDYTLGEGAFEKIYEQTPNMGYLADYFVQLYEGINNVLAEQTKNAKKDVFRNKKAKK